MTAKIGDRGSFYEPDHKDSEQKKEKKPLSSRRVESGRDVFIARKKPEVNIGYGKDPRLQNIIRRHLLET